MSQKKQDINVPKVGMTEKHLSQLREGEYPFALNTNVEHNNGNGFPLLQNEPSNILCSNFKEGYKVIGVQKDVTNNRTFFFLVNPTRAEIDILEVEYQDTVTGERSALQTEAGHVVMMYTPDGVTTNSFKINSTGASFEVDGAVQYTFPLADGTVGQALITDGNGALSWGGSGNGLIIQGSDNMYPAENIPPNIDLDFATANLIIGVDSAPNLTTESNNIYLGSYIDGSSTESIAIGNSTVVTGLQSIAIGHTSSANHDSSVVFSGGASTAANQLIFAQAGEVFFRVGADILINGGWSAAGTNVSGHNLVLAGGRGTGNATSGGLLFQTPDAGASGSTRQSLTEKMRLTNGGDLVIDLATKGLVLKDTQGTPHYWRVTISTLGVLTTTDLGTTIPT